MLLKLITRHLNVLSHAMSASLLQLPLIQLKGSLGIIFARSLTLILVTKACKVKVNALQGPRVTGLAGL